MSIRASRLVSNGRAGRRWSDATSVGPVERNPDRALFTPRERERVEGAPVARLATVRPDGRPHLVPVTFAFTAPEVAVSAVDHKPKRTSSLQRLRNVEAHPEVSLLVDHYDDDWAALWWVRMDATAHVVRDGASRDRLAEALVRKYEAYAARPPAGPVVVMTVHTVVSWPLEEDRT
jgi:PPOX class probable F420-dependent enzyme